MSNVTNTSLAPRRFEVAPLDPYAARVTSGLAYLGGLLALPLLFAYLANLRWGGLIVPVALALALAVFLLLAYIAQPSGYELGPSGLLVRRRLLRPLRVPLSQISAAAPATGLADAPARSLRFAFNPGVFGYQGPFHLAPFGEAYFQATHRGRLVAIARQGAVPLVISPARTRDFLEALGDLRSQAAVAELAAGPPDQPLPQ